MNITVINRQKDLSIDSKQVVNLFTHLIAYKKLKVDELEVHFVTDSRMKKEHRVLFDDPSSTDCITCPMDDPYDADLDYCVLGSCLICPKTAVIYAKENAYDVYNELSLYCVHCFLHLIGFDDIEPEDRKKMRAQEKRCLAYLSKHNALLKAV